MTDIAKFTVFAYNYPNGFINKVWSGSIADHLQSKFNNYYQSEGAKGVMLAFYMSLDSGNKAKLEAFILESNI